MSIGWICQLGYTLAFGGMRNSRTTMREMAQRLQRNWEIFRHEGMGRGSGERDPGDYGGSAKFLTSA